MRRSVMTALLFSLPLLTAGAYFGPQLVSGYFFMNALATADAASQASSGPWPQLHDTCTLCHGSKGQSGNAQYPQLAGQSAAYIEAQLHAFADGKRESPLMHPLAASLSDAEISSLAAYFSHQTPEALEAEVDNAFLAQSGRDLVAAKSCSACHGPNLEGGPIAPRIRGLGEHYLRNQLTAFKQGRRIDPTHAMNTVAATLSEQGIIALAYFVAFEKTAEGGSESK